MALNPVSLDERLRPWYLAGVTHFILPESGSFFPEEKPPLPSPAPHQETSFTAPPRPADGPAYRSSPHQQTAQTGQAPAATYRSHPSESSFAADQTTASFSAAASARDAAPAPLAGPKEQPQARAAQADDFPKLPLEEWPLQWQERLKKTPQAPVIWTYPELGYDLSGRGDKSRSDCLKKLIGSLGLPKGSSAFWPLSLPKKDQTPQNGLEALSSGDDTDTAEQTTHESRADANDDYVYFRNGLLLLKPHAIVLFGPGSIGISGLPLSLPAPFMQGIYQGTLHVLLPDFSSIQGSATIFAKTATYLRTALSTVPGLFR